MRKIGAMAAVALLALLVALPLGIVMAQDGETTSGNRPPATIYGTVMADGLPVPQGTMITAMVGDQKVGSAMVMEGGKFGPLQLMEPAGDSMTGRVHGWRTDGIVHLRLDERWPGDGRHLR